MEENLKHYAIGEVVKLTGISAHTLRYYDKMDVFKPSYIDTETGYRYYDSNQFWKFEIIKLCKYMEFTLDDVREILNRNQDDVFVEILRKQRPVIQEQIAKYNRVLKDLDWYLEENENMNKVRQEKHEIILKELDERKVIYKRNVRSYKEFHLTLQSISLKETENQDTIRRHYGHFFDIEEFQKGFFYREGEFLDLALSDYCNTDKNDIFTLPKGRYVTLITNVRGEKKGIRKILKYLKDNKFKPKLVCGIEIGWPLFDALNDLFCEVQVLVEQERGLHEIQDSSCTDKFR